MAQLFLFKIFERMSTGMRIIDGEQITQVIRKLCIDACCYLSEDVKKLLEKAMRDERSELGRYSLDKVIRNYEIAEQKTVPICQDTGVTVVFAELGCEAFISGKPLQELVDEGIRQGYTEGCLRMSIVEDPVFERKNTEDNTPAVLHIKIVDGDRVKLKVLPKGAGSENMSALKMLKPSDGVEGIKRFVLQAVEASGGNPCPPIIVGVGIGGTAEKAMQLAKEALSGEAGLPHADNRYAELESDLLSAINELGIGPQGFGGKVTALAVHILTYPTHMAMLPVAVSINCHAARHREVVI